MSGGGRSDVGKLAIAYRYASASVAAGATKVNADPASPNGSHSLTNHRTRLPTQLHNRSNWPIHTGADVALLLTKLLTLPSIDQHHRFPLVTSESLEQVDTS